MEKSDQLDIFKTDWIRVIFHWSMNLVEGLVVEVSYLNILYLFKHFFLHSEGAEKTFWALQGSDPFFELPLLASHICCLDMLGASKALRENLDLFRGQGVSQNRLAVAPTTMGNICDASWFSKRSEVDFKRHKKQSCQKRWKQRNLMKYDPKYGRFALGWLRWTSHYSPNSPRIFIQVGSEIQVQTIQLLIKYSPLQNQVQLPTCSNFSPIKSQVKKNPHQNNFHPQKIGGGLKYYFFHPDFFGEMIQSDGSHIFQMGWFNHQLENLRFGCFGFKVMRLR